jgi:hypothetical protein
MALELWVGGGGHWFVDTGLGRVQVGQTYQNSDGTWDVEVNDVMLAAPDLEATKRIFMENYDRRRSRLVRCRTTERWTPRSSRLSHYPEWP